jgi:hypothetical protein
MCRRLSVQLYPWLTDRLPKTIGKRTTIWSAVLNAQRGASNIVLLTALGGGAFGNEEAWIIGALRRALQLASQFAIDVKLVSYGTPSNKIVELVDEIDVKFS